MTDRSSRHADAPTYRVPGPAAQVEILRPRMRVRPDAEVVHVAAATDRLDLLAWTYLGDPHQYWRIADANPGTALADLCQPGRPLDIPGRPS